MQEDVDALGARRQRLQAQVKIVQGEDAPRVETPPPPPSPPPAPPAPTHAHLPSLSLQPFRP